MAGFEQLLPLRQPSALAEPESAKNIYTLSEGTIGEISAVITAAVVEVIRSSEERIDRQMLDRIDYAPTSAWQWVHELLGCCNR
ncbi:hypothetical protein DDQ68_14950 [Hymenobacter nivis]|uniref:Uncharacterized protein n=1 Tax=Hymenobacter nivis TaxID=1850093 RepID=A0A2Z3GYX5_9BACT|nr:hypothetical protein DDQ68_14950 [Hymenobacter nivis]